MVFYERYRNILMPCTCLKKYNKELSNCQTFLQYSRTILQRQACVQVSEYLFTFYFVKFQVLISYDLSKMDGICFICFDPITRMRGEYIIQFNCGCLHGRLIHSSCFLDYFKHRVENRIHPYLMCPFCRQPVRNTTMEYRV